MKKLAISLIAALAVPLSACGAPGDSDETATSAPTTSTTSSTSTTTSSTIATSSETTTEQNNPVPAGDYPAQADMQQQGANADRVNRFQDSQGRYWLCDKATPQGNPEVPEYNTPNGCMGPFNTLEELQDGLYGAMADALAEEFDIDTETLDPPAPEAVSSDDIADGIAEDLGCEGATMNEDGSYSYYGCGE
ncbi:hypothetical protein [Corynebacterium hiratae]|uniref:Secreted protein n=1 Tax=Corynebacterium aurimucosum TaxID=169292 RepID=A0A6I3KAY1_9CORY|nr:hypothetical protein [Corynebacterium aurimucosum]MTD91147.1 hypothetical protein [Corynebacterium aurimucosum]